MIIEKKNNIQLADILKTLNNGSKVLDFDKIAALGFPIHLLMTYRGALGKSFNMKLHLKKQFDKTNQPSIWLMNTAKQIKKEKEKFLSDMTKQTVAHSIDIEEWKALSTRGNPDDLNTRVCNKEGVTIFDLVALNQAEYYKGSRQNPYAICFDEFNAGSERVAHYIEKFDSLIHSNEDVVNDGLPPKIFFFGNSKSLAHPLIFKLGITIIKQEITTFYTENGDPFMIVISPIVDKVKSEEINERHKHNPFFHLSNQLGTGDHAYKNETLYDELNFVNPYFTGDGKDKLLDLKFNVIKDNQYYQIYAHNSGITRGEVPHYHVRAVSIPDKNIITVCFNRKDVKEGVVLRKDIQTNLIKQTISTNVQFENAMSRVLFIRSLA